MQSDLKLKGYGVKHYRCGVYAFYLDAREAEAQAIKDRTTVVEIAVDRNEYHNLTWQRITEEEFGKLTKSSS